jgi:hypothetical protein
MSFTTLPPDPFSALGPADSITIGQMAPLLTAIFFWPGNWLLWAVSRHLPAVARFLEIEAHDYGGVLAASLSATAWVFVAVALSLCWKAVRDFDEALTATLVRGHAGLRRRVRVARALIMHRLKSRAPKTSLPDTLELVEELEIGERDLRILRALAALAPGYALPVSEAAATVGVPKHEAERTLHRLTRLNLLAAALGGPDGEHAYTLTKAGRGFLLFQQMKPKAPLRPHGAAQHARNEPGRAG